MVQFQDSQIDVLVAIGDALCAPLSAADMEPYLTNSIGVTAAEFGAYTPGTSQAFRHRLSTALGYLADEPADKLSKVLTILSMRPLALPFTGSLKLLTEMDRTERTKALTGLRDARLALFRSLFSCLSGLILLTFVAGDETVAKAIGKPLLNPAFDQLTNVPKFRPTLFDVGHNTILNYDAVIVGSGSTAGVAAYRLTKAGLRVLLLEKADYLDPDSAQFTEMDLLSNCFEGHGFTGTRSNSLSFLSGSTVGGGGAVNWSCSLDTPPAVRKTWAKEAVPFYGDREYDEALAAIRGVMKTTKDIKKHSFTNQLLLDGSDRLGYAANVASQNTGDHDPNTGFVGWGHRHGEKGGVVNWLHYALNNGADLIASAKADKIVHSHGKASGVLVHTKGKELLVVAPRVIVCSGSLQTPVLLRKSGFKNKHIGKGLKLHPSCVLLSEFDELVNKADDPIMTAVVTEFTNLDGENHGPRLEAVQHLTSYLAGFLPWKNGEQYHKDLARISSMSAILVLHRERGSGTVSVSSDGRPNVDYDVGEWDRKAMQQGSAGGANLAYIQGCKRIIWPNPTVPDFIPSRPPGNRYLTDSDYQEWLTNALKVPFDAFSYRVGSAHQMASCRMNNKGPRHGALDDHGRLYECRNVYVVDASAMPSASGTNPMITCMATAWVLSGRLLDEMQRARL